MKQSRSTSFIKSLVSTGVGFAVAMMANAIVLPLFGFTPSLSDNLLITTVYTAISVARGYLLERTFEAMGWRVRMSPFAIAVLAERQRQINEEGWSSEHDDEHPTGELARAGATYADWAHLDRRKRRRHSVPPSWPWDPEWWKPQDFRRNLIKACALILAEGERFERLRKSTSSRAITDDRKNNRASIANQKDRATP